jgi:hypothetical protein
MTSWNLSKPENCENPLANAPLLHLPGGQIIPNRQEIVAVTAQEMMQMANFHDIAQRHGFCVVCQACDAPLQGDNDGQGRLWAVKCRCRVWQADMGVQRPA